MDLRDFTSGPLTLADIMQVLKNWISTLPKHLLVQEFVVDLKAGKTSAVVTLAATASVGALLFYLVWYSLFDETEISSPAKEPEKEPIIARDFTTEQLREFDGKKGKPIYIGLDGDVFDVSSAKEYYGEGAAYNCFAGRNATRAMAKFSFDEAELSNDDVSDLGPFEKNTLEDWVQKFKYMRCYPVVGKYSFPPSSLSLTVEELRAFDGTQAADERRVNSPVYVALKGKIYDVSYGGFELYGKDGPYHRFAGRDVSRALAKMSFEETDINSRDISDLSPEQLKVLQDWIDKFEKSKKYPIVGSLVE